jgi:hypothetical protein
VKSCYRLTGALLLVVAFVSPAFSQAPIAMSPARFINLVTGEKYRHNMGPLWNQLKIPVSEFGSSYYQISSRSLGNPSSPDVTVVRLEIYGWLSRFVVFRRSIDSSAWMLIGYVDIDQRREVDPTYRLRRGSMGDLLLVDETTDSGSGIGSGSTHWFQINDSDVQPVLEYVNGGYAAGNWLGIGAADQTVRSRLVSLGVFDGRQEVSISLSSTFETYDHVRLCTYQRTVVYSRTGRGAFVLDANRSGVTKGDVMELFDIHRFSLSRFHSECRESIEKVVKAKGGRTRDWYADLIQDLKSRRSF